VRIHIVTPVAPNAVIGNEHTARRYARLLRGLGHRVTVEREGVAPSGDLLIALHARRSYPALRRFAVEQPDRPRILVLTGTDVYRDIHSDADASHALDLATRLVVLQRHAAGELPERVRPKTRIIYQSAPCLDASIPRPTRSFRVCVVGHLRAEKDPFRTALAARHLPETSRVEVIHVGAALSADMAARAEEASAVNARYRWLGDQPHWKARRLLASSHLLAITSLLEGSSNVLCEALAQATPTPVVASHIGGLIGTLGESYPGYYPVEDTLALAELLRRAEDDGRFYERLASHCAVVAPLVSVDGERQAWAALLDEFR
jgi:putative glycosyltransferase (TIGR04348 family)